jgi:hypothetical protein
MAAHARLGPSDSSRWLNCAGAVNFTKDYPNEATEFAAEGTVAHWVREQCLDLGFEPFDFVGTKMRADGFMFEVDAEMAEHLQPGIDEIREFDGPLFVERRISLDRWMPGQFGTLDAGVAGEKLIVISDLKFGEGVPVQAVENTQQMIYALGFGTKSHATSPMPKTFSSSLTSRATGRAAAHGTLRSMTCCRSARRCAPRPQPP